MDAAADYSRSDTTEFVRPTRFTDAETSVRTALREAYLQAALSPDPSNQNGAIIINPLRDNGGYITGYRTIAKAHNGFHPAIRYTRENLLDRDWKLKYIEHAERAVIYQRGLFRHDEIMVCPWFACIDCARAIVLSGCKLVVGHKQRMDLTPDRWKQSVQDGHDYMTDCGVEMYFYDGPPICKAQGLGASLSVTVNGNSTVL
jgi:deoxycytidylate deaminase